MLARKYRFHGLGSVRPTMRRGATVRGAGFSLKRRTDSRTPHARLAVIISKKVDKRAVVRNKIRRRVYEALRDEIMNAPSNLDVVVIVYTPQLAERDFELLQKQLIAALHQK